MASSTPASLLLPISPQPPQHPTAMVAVEPAAQVMPQKDSSVAQLGVDINHDGRPDIFLTGPDHNHTGLPDVIDWAMTSNRSSRHPTPLSAQPQVIRSVSHPPTLAKLAPATPSTQPQVVTILQPRPSTEVATIYVPPQRSAIAPPAMAPMAPPAMTPMVLATEKVSPISTDAAIMQTWPRLAYPGTTVSSAPMTAAPTPARLLSGKAAAPAPILQTLQAVDPLSQSTLASGMGARSLNNGGYAVPLIRQAEPLRPIAASTRVAREASQPISSMPVREASMPVREASVSRDDPELGQLRGVLAEREHLVGELERQIAGLRQQLLETEARLGQDVSERDNHIAGQAQLIEELQQLSGQQGGGGGGGFMGSEIVRLRNTVEEQAAKIVELERSRMGDSEYFSMQANGGIEQPLDAFPMDVVATEEYFPENTDAAALAIEKGQALTVISTSGEWATVKTQQGRAGVVPLYCLGMQESSVQSAMLVLDLASNMISV